MMKKHLRITVNGKSYDVVAEILEDEGGAPRAPAGGTVAVAGSAAVIAAAPPPRKAPLTSGAGEVRAPLAGKVVAVDAGVGTAVAAGQTVITLEAMKMNTLITTPVAGTVADVHVNPGDAVEEGQLLMTIG